MSIYGLKSMVSCDAEVVQLVDELVVKVENTIGLYASGSSLIRSPNSSRLLVSPSLKTYDPVKGLTLDNMLTAEQLCMCVQGLQGMTPAMDIQSGSTSSIELSVTNEGSLSVERLLRGIVTMYKLHQATDGDLSSLGSEWSDLLFGLQRMNTSRSTALCDLLESIAPSIVRSIGSSGYVDDENMSLIQSEEEDSDDLDLMTTHTLISNAIFGLQVSFRILIVVIEALTYVLCDLGMRWSIEKCGKHSACLLSQTSSFGTSV
jgi:hypothetical protein